MTKPTSRVETAELAFQGPRFEVRRLTARDAGGAEHRRDVVVHPGAVVILPLLAAASLDERSVSSGTDDAPAGPSRAESSSEPEVVLIRNHRVAVNRTLWELPAGTLEPGESPAACAARELVEETGYRAARLQPVCEFYTSPGICTERMHAFLAEDLTWVGQSLDEGEQISVAPTRWSEAMRMARSGEITDGKTLTLLLWQAAISASPAGGPRSQEADDAA